MTASRRRTVSAVESRAALREEHVARVNQVLDHIERHLTDDLTLATLAGVAGFSPYHFHRIFTSVMGETPRRFIHRVRVERAAAELLLHPRTPITRIALDCGFSGPAPFARAFQEAFGMSATEWRIGGLRPGPGGEGATAGGGLYRSAGEGPVTASGHTPAGRRSTVVFDGLDAVTRRPLWWLRVLDREPAPVTLEEIRPCTVAYLRSVGPYAGNGALFARLFGALGRWAGPRGLLADGDGWWICVYHDPQVTADERLRVTVGLTVPVGTRTEGEISTMTVDGGTYAMGRFLLREDEHSGAWAAMIGTWLPGSGYELDDRHCFERFPAASLGPDAEGSATGERDASRVRQVDICLPVRPASR